MFYVIILVIALTVCYIIRFAVCHTLDKGKLQNLRKLIVAITIDWIILLLHERMHTHTHTHTHSCTHTHTHTYTHKHACALTIKI